MEESRYHKTSAWGESLSQRVVVACGYLVAYKGKGEGESIKEPYCLRKKNNKGRRRGEGEDDMQKNKIRDKIR